LSAFFFGNNVPLEKFKHLYRICNETYTEDTATKINHFYWLWEASRYTRHMAHYYNILHRTFIWINGRALHQLETQKPEVTVMDFGIAGTYCEPEIREKIKLRLGIENS
jgi:hypothetical protein